MTINWNSPMIKFAEGAILAGGSSVLPVLHHLHHGLTIKAVVCILGSAFIGGAFKWIKQHTSPTILASLVNSASDAAPGDALQYKLEPKA